MSNVQCAADGTMFVLCTIDAVQQGKNVGTSASYAPKWYTADEKDNTGYPMVRYATGYSDDDPWSVHEVTEVTFTTPTLDVPASYVRLRIPTVPQNVPANWPVSGWYNTTEPVRYSICTSNAKRNSYINTNAKVVDSSSIVQDKCDVTVKGENSFLVVDIPVNKLQSNKQYWMYIWPGYQSYGGSTDGEPVNIGEYIYLDGENTEVSVCSPAGCVVLLSNGEVDEPYSCHIDNGKTWDLCAPHIDNGQDFEAYGGA